MLAQVDFQYLFNRIYNIYVYVYLHIIPLYIRIYNIYIEQDYNKTFLFIIFKYMRNMYIV